MTPPDSLALIIAGSAGIFIGSTIGIFVAGMVSQRRNRRATAEAWLAAERFYSRAYHMTPKR